MDCYPFAEHIWKVTPMCHIARHSQGRIDKQSVIDAVLSR